MSARHLLLLSTVVLLLTACSEPGNPKDGTESDGRRVGKADGFGAVVPDLPSASSPLPWGGAHAEDWKPEAVFANAVSAELNRYWSEPDVRDVVVAVPGSLADSDLRPFGDGQTNAGFSFPWWSHTAPPLVATLVKRQASADVVFRFHGSLEVTSATVELSDGRTLEIPAVASAAGTEAIWRAEGDDTWLANPNATALVIPGGWSAGFPVHFYLPLTGVSELSASAPEAMRDFGSGRTLPDPEDVAGDNPLGLLAEHPRGPGYNAVPYEAAHAHGDHPHEDRLAAVGKIWSWVAEPPAVPFKHVYLCAEGRRFDLETAHGVPSGAGWHEVGDAAESLVNSLSDKPMLVAHAVDTPLSEGPLAGRTTAYEMNTVAVAGWMRPGQALVTSADSGAWQGHAAYHWYAYHEQAPACVEIWVHPCRSATGTDFGCGQVEVTFAIEADTAWGQRVAVVGEGAELGNWRPFDGVALAPTAYPTWHGSTFVPSGTTLTWKVVTLGADGSVLWEPGPNRTTVVDDRTVEVVATRR